MLVPDFAHTVSGRLATFNPPPPKGKKTSTRKKGASSVPSGWPHTHPSSEELAKAGFYYAPTSPQSDNVRCFLCCQNFDGWEASDNPVVEHFKLSPNCGWAVSCHIGMFGPLPTDDPLSERAIELRTATFDGRWPHDEKRGWRCKTKKMVEAGWSYDPSPEYDDCAKCFYCDLTLDGWEPKDDPWKEHEKRAPQCPFFTLSHEMATKRQAKPAPKKTRGRKKASTASNMADDVSVVSMDESVADDDSIMSTASNSTSVVKKQVRRTTRGKRQPSIQPEEELSTLVPSSDASQPKRTRSTKSKNESLPPPLPEDSQYYLDTTKEELEPRSRPKAQPQKSILSKSKKAAPQSRESAVEDDDGEPISEYLSSTQLSVDANQTSRGVKRSSLGGQSGFQEERDRGSYKKQRTVNGAGYQSPPQTKHKVSFSAELEEEDEVEEDEEEEHDAAELAAGAEEEVEFVESDAESHHHQPAAASPDVISLEDFEEGEVGEEVVHDNDVDEESEGEVEVHSEDGEVISNPDHDDEHIPDEHSQMSDVSVGGDDNAEEHYDSDEAHDDTAQPGSDLGEEDEVEEEEDDEEEEDKENVRQGRISHVSAPRSSRPSLAERVARTPSPPSEDEDQSPEATPTPLPPRAGSGAGIGHTPLHLQLSSAARSVPPSSGPDYISTPSPSPSTAHSRVTVVPPQPGYGRSPSPPLSRASSGVRSQTRSSKGPQTSANPAVGGGKSGVSAAVAASSLEKSTPARDRYATDGGDSSPTSVPPSSMLKAMTGTPFSPQRTEVPDQQQQRQQWRRSGSGAGRATGLDSGSPTPRTDRVVPPTGPAKGPRQAARRSVRDVSDEEPEGGDDYGEQDDQGDDDGHETDSEDKRTAEKAVVPLSAPAAWEPIDLDSLSLHSPTSEPSLPAHLRPHFALLSQHPDSDPDEHNHTNDEDESFDPEEKADILTALAGTASSGTTAGGDAAAVMKTALRVRRHLTPAERAMTLEQWVAYNAEKGEERLRWECERLVAVFEAEGRRAMEAIEGIRTVDG